MHIKSFAERYPTGRKHCSRCTRWRPISDFSVVKWETQARERPFKLQSRCVCCERVRLRDYQGNHQRKVFNPYPAGSERWRAFRAERKRVRYHEMKKDREWLKLRREYYRFYHEVKGTYNGRTKVKKGLLIGAGSGKLALDPVKVAEFIDSLVVKNISENNGTEKFTINGKSLTDSETHVLGRWRDGKYRTAAIATVDAWCVKFEIPLWEIEESAKLAA